MWVWMRSVSFELYMRPCFNNPEKPTVIDIILTNYLHPFKFLNSCVVETQPSDFHKMELTVFKMECAKFRGSRAIVGLVGLVPPCHRAFVGPKIFFVGISWVSIFFSWVFRGSKSFSRGYFMGPKLFLVGISWVQNFFSWVFRESRMLRFSVNFSKKQKETYD